MLTPADVAALSAAGAPGSPVHEAGEACARLRWHRALRRRADEVHDEVLVRAASASAALEGARVPPEALRAALSGAVEDPALALGVAALRATVAVDDAGDTLLRAPAGVMARAHAAAAVAWLPSDLLGRPRAGAAPAAQEVARLVVALRGTSAPLPAAVVAAVAEAEVSVGDLFPPVSGIVARALARGIIRAAGLDPFGVSLPEAAAARDAAARRAVLDAYPDDGGRGWVDWWARSLAEGAHLGGEVADEVVSG